MEATAVLYKVVVDEGLVGEEAGEGMLDQVGTSREVADVGHGLPGPRYTLNMHSIRTQYVYNVYSTYCEIAHVQRLWAWPAGNTITCTQYVFNMYTICTQYVLKMYSTFGEVANVGQRLPGPPHVSNMHSFFVFC